jgi:phosphate starvation-inducible protein PhoH and related proteins
MSEAILSLHDPAIALQLFGPQDSNLRAVRNQFGVAITHRGNQIRVSGEPEAVRLATDILEQLKARAMNNSRIGPETVAEVLETNTGNDKSFSKSEVEIGAAGKRIRPRTEGQSKYVEAIRKFDMTFCIGPAGCGKTYLAVATAVEALKSRQIKKIVLVRPAVEAGESLGFLPGDLQAKLNPYLRPLLDAIHDMVDYEQIKFLMEQETIEVIPLAYMRGRTLNNAFIILDEAQNATVSQMKMFLTRMGHGSKVVISGDVTQIDLPGGVTSGLKDAIQRLRGIREIAQIRLDETDIVRHALVQRIVTAYDKSKSISPSVIFDDDHEGTDKASE